MKVSSTLVWWYKAGSQSHRRGIHHQAEEDRKALQHDHKGGKLEEHTEAVEVGKADYRVLHSLLVVAEVLEVQVGMEVDSIHHTPEDKDARRVLHNAHREV